MFSEIYHILKVLKFQKFNGHVKIGIENGSVVSLTRDFIFNDANKDCEEISVEDNIRNYLNLTQNGRMEFDLFNGKIINMTASDNKNGAILKKWLGETQCKSVKVVVVKSNILP